MELRRHPRLNWPPTWTGSGTEVTYGERGTLTDAKKLPAFGPNPLRLCLTIEHGGHPYSAVIQVNDPDFLDVLLPKLRGCIGRPLTEVGSLELPD